MSQLERGERSSHDDQRPKRILSLDEILKLITHTDSHYRLLVELLLTTGLRIGEALGLTVADLDKRNSVIRVEYQLARDGTRTPLKTTESRRTVDIPPLLMRRLVEQVETRGDLFTKTAYVLASRNGTGLERKTARGALQRAVAAAGIDAPHPTLHDLRHTHASMLIALDVSLVDIQHRLGRRKPETTLRIYAHQWRYHDAQRSEIGTKLEQLSSTNATTVQGSDNARSTS